MVQNNKKEKVPPTFETDDPYGQPAPEGPRGCFRQSGSERRDYSNGKKITSYSFKIFIFLSLTTT